MCQVTESQQTVYYYRAHTIRLIENFYIGNNKYNEKKFTCKRQQSKQEKKTNVKKASTQLPDSVKLKCRACFCVRCNSTEHRIYNCQEWLQLRSMNRSMKFPLRSLDRFLMVNPPTGVVVAMDSAIRQHIHVRYLLCLLNRKKNKQKEKSLNNTRNATHQKVCFHFFSFRFNQTKHCSNLANDFQHFVCDSGKKNRSKHTKQKSICKANLNVLKN